MQHLLVRRRVDGDALRQHGARAAGVLARAHAHGDAEQTGRGSRRDIETPRQRLEFLKEIAPARRRLAVILCSHGRMESEKLSP